MALFQEPFNLYLSSLIVWGFLMAFLYNLVQKSASPGSDSTAMWVAFTIFLSYLVGDPLLHQSIGYDILNSTTIYAIWAAYDVVTLLFIAFISAKKTVENLPAKIYIIIGFSVNIFLFLGMYVDLQYGKYIGAWWFWHIYSIGVNLSDIMMIIALVLNKDFLGFAKCYKWILKNKTLSQSRCI